ncbi:cyanophycinase [Massilia dura]|uniref:Cyanophycinase n=1 Tax=Pseudoduganella dura TaxID=321982 RepID=A0A6I3XP15_9BURK|nr:cyanophycinase [Pseudoduganella dura]MUI16183.1 cyanophycinase [Pseudoduganella dura]GGY19200.1 cyanophycinase [Pseudoduganella dura]
MTERMPDFDGGRHGHLVIVGGHEDHENSKEILSRFVQLSGGQGAAIAVITAASRVPDKMWERYDVAFREIGVREVIRVDLPDRATANDPALAVRVRACTGIWMTGGDQKRLLAMIGGTLLDEAMHAALKESGACIGGTSAGASAMCGHMLADGKADLLPEKGSVSLGAGLGFVQRVVIDQHFSERHRLARLLTIVAQNPYLLGVGIDEDTALVVERGVGIEVIGAGSVTVVDGRTMISDVADISTGGTPQLIDVRLHLLPAGSSFALSGEIDHPHQLPPGATHTTPAPLLDFVRNVTKRTSLS